jgi:DNA-binding transcriptional regulator YdaS (Cro superfamily)
MLKTSVIQHFGSMSAVARALGIKKQAVQQWPELVPRGSAYQVEVVTAGALKVDPEVYLAKKLGA